MKIVSIEKGDTIKYFYIEVELKDKRIAEVTLIENYQRNGDYTSFDISIINDEEFNTKEIDRIGRFIKDNF